MRITRRKKRNTLFTSAQKQPSYILIFLFSTCSLSFEYIFLLLSVLLLYGMCLLLHPASTSPCILFSMLTESGFIQANQSFRKVFRTLTSQQCCLFYFLPLLLTCVLYSEAKLNPPLKFELGMKKSSQDRRTQRETGP